MKCLFSEDNCLAGWRNTLILPPNLNFVINILLFHSVVLPCFVYALRSFQNINLIGVARQRTETGRGRNAFPHLIFVSRESNDKTTAYWFRSSMVNDTHLPEVFAIRSVLSLSVIAYYVACLSSQVPSRHTDSPTTSNLLKHFWNTSGLLPRTVCTTSLFMLYVAFHKNREV